MPSLYRACHCLVAPYRGEAFCLPLAEAMACGLPVIATGHGACLEYCDPSAGMLLPARIVRAGESRVGEQETVSRPWWAEVEPQMVAAAMRSTFEQPLEAQALGAHAADHILHTFSWREAAAKALERLEAIGRQPPAPRQPPRRRRQLSVCLIAKDEEPFIGQCLESVRGLADEIVVVDTGSGDRTVEIAEEHGARVRRFAWTNDFAAARNESLAHATKDWILVLDADERLDAASHDEVLRLIGEHALVGYMLRTLNYLDEEGPGSVFEHLNLRLFPNHSDLRYVGRDPHAQLQALRPELPFLIEPCDAVIHHEGYRPQHSEARQKSARNRIFLERAVAEEPGNPFHAFNLGVAYYNLGHDEEAERELRRAVVLSPQVDAAYPLYVVNARLTLALALFRRGRYPEAAEECREALRLAPDFADAHATLASCEARLGRLDDALLGYARALRCSGQAAVAGSDRSASGWRSLVAMAEIYLLQGRFGEATGCLERARELNPDSPLVREALAQARAQTGG